MRTFLIATGMLVLVACGASACGKTAQKQRARPPIDGYHYNGSTEHGEMMTFSAYGMSLPLFEAKFACGKTVGTTGVEAVKVERQDGRYSFDLAVKGLVGYADGAPDENGDIHIRGSFARDARTASGDLTVTTPRCASGTVHWSAKAEPEVRR